MSCKENIVDPWLTVAKWFHVIHLIAVKFHCNLKCFSFWFYLKLDCKSSFAERLNRAWYMEWRYEKFAHCQQWIGSGIYSFKIWKYDEILLIIDIMFLFLIWKSN